jgi:hypothetical protein
MIERSCEARDRREMRTSIRKGERTMDKGS